VKVSAIGGHFMFDDDQETPNTLNCAFEFNENGKRQMMEFEVRHWMTNPEASVGVPLPNGQRPDSDDPVPGAPPPPPSAAPRGPNSDRIGDIFYGSKGYLAVDSYSSYKSWLGRANEPGPAKKGGGDHFLNFVEAIRTRKRESLKCEVEEGAISSMLVHLANISYRVGRTLNFDPATLTIKGDAEASALMTRKYRSPYVVPEKV